MSIKVNGVTLGTIPGAIKYNGTNLKKVIFNGTTVWQEIIPNGHQVFSAGGTWKAPAGVTDIYLFMINSGRGGGGSGATSSRGGGASGKLSHGDHKVTPGSSYSVTVGETCSFGSLRNTSGTGNGGGSAGGLGSSGNRGGGANGGAGGPPFLAWAPGIGYFQSGGGGGGGGGLTHSLLPAKSAGSSGGKGGNGWGAGGGGGYAEGGGGGGAQGVVLVMWGSSINKSFSY